MPERAMGVLVADDEMPARRRLLDLLRHEPGISSVWEATDGQMTVDLIRSCQPDLLFLDVKMPELDGLAVIDTVGIPAMPLTIFVTAFDEHAIRAFEANALDYLLKPYSDARFRSAMSRARARLDDRGARRRAWSAGPGSGSGRPTGVEALTTVADLADAPPGQRVCSAAVGGCPGPVEVNFARPVSIFAIGIRNVQ